MVVRFLLTSTQITSNLSCVAFCINFHGLLIFWISPQAFKIRIYLISDCVFQLLTQLLYYRVERVVATIAHTDVMFRRMS